MLRTLLLAAPVLAGCMQGQAQAQTTQAPSPADPVPAVRVQRDAGNPLRMIIEAGKLKARPKTTAEARAGADAEPPVKRAAPRTAGTKAPDAPAEAAAAAKPAALAAAAPTPSRAPPLSLVLADYVEPVVPERVRSRLRGVPEVVLDLLVRADGSVGEATVRSSTDKALEPLALAAVRQWRYKPIAEDQPHAVQMVFRQ